MGTRRRLSDLPVGRRGRVVRVLGEGALTRRIHELGLIPGEEVRVAGVAPFGDPLEVEVQGYSLSLRGKEAESVEIEEL
jgi:Fe2+ transport system protein FeoA